MNREPNSDGKETGTQINSLEQKDERNIQPEQSEETRIQKNEESLGTSGTTLNVLTSESGVPEGEKEEPEMKSYLKKY